MAEQSTDESEKEFDATDAKRQQARDDGNVPQSKELNLLALILGILCAGAALKVSLGNSVFSEFSELMYHADAFAIETFEYNGQGIEKWILGILAPLSVLFLIPASIVLVTLIAQRAISFSVKKIAIDMKKISPVENIKKRYGARGITDFLKDSLKLAFAAMMAIAFLAQLAKNYYASSAIQNGQFAQFTFDQSLLLIIWFLVFQVFLAAIDLPLQQRLHSNQLKMTREELKKEMKQSEGDPQLKQQRRQAGSKITRGQMLQNVKDATVIMVNPEHYAVALKWNPEENASPICVAKGVDHLAAKIREIALEHNVPIHRDPPSARSIYKLVEVDQEILPEHFAAVAAAINFVERVRQHM